MRRHPTGSRADDVGHGVVTAAVLAHEIRHVPDGLTPGACGEIRDERRTSRVGAELGVREADARSGHPHPEWTARLPCRRRDVQPSGDH
ncbi:MAG: hypothetical protein ACR2HQ_15530 [Ilumatobacteraceae bacterium]